MADALRRARQPRHRRRGGNASPARRTPNWSPGCAIALRRARCHAAGGRDGGRGRAGSDAWSWRTAAGSPAATCWSRSAGGRTSTALDLAAGNVRAAAGRHRHRSRTAQPDQPARLSPWATSPTRRASARAPSPMSARYHAGIVIRRALFRLPARIDYAALPRVTYTDPELAQVGMTEAEARAAGHRCRVLRWPLADNDRAAAEARHRRAGQAGRRAASRVLGAGILAPNAGEMIGLWTLAIRGKSPYRRWPVIVPYPTRAEAAKRAAGSFFAPRLFATPPSAPVAGWPACPDPSAHTLVHTPFCPHPSAQTLVPRPLCPDWPPGVAPGGGAGHFRPMRKRTSCA